MTAYRYCPRCGSTLRADPDRHQGRPACPDGRCGFVHWDNPLPVVAAIVEHEGCIVLARNRDWPEGFFGLVTGFVEPREDPAQAVRREVHEELALIAQDPTLVGVYPFERANQVIIAYHVPASGEIRLNEELAEYRRIPPGRLRVWPGGTGTALRDWLRRARGIDPPVIDWPARAGR